MPTVVRFSTRGMPFCSRGLVIQEGKNRMGITKAKAHKWQVLSDAVATAYRVQDARFKGLPETHLMRQVIIGIRLGLAAVMKYQQGYGADLLEYLQQFECPRCKAAACEMQEEQINLVQMIETWTCPRCGWESRLIPRELQR